MKKKLTIISLLAGAAMLVASNANAITYGFAKITANGNPDVSSQLSVDVTSGGSGLVSFQFFNNVGIASSISEIYFQDGLLGAPSITESAGVVFQVGAPPASLPGGNLASPPFVTSVMFDSSSDNPQVTKGVNASTEWVTLTFGLGSFADITAIDNALSARTLRIGLHVPGYVAGTTESYVNGGPIERSLVPDGGSTVALLGFALVGVDFLRRRIGRA